MGRLDLANTTHTGHTVDEGGEKTDDAIVANTTEVLEEWAGQKVGRIGERRGTGASGGKEIRRREKEAEASS